MDGRIHRVAAAGNAVALVCLVLLLSQSDVLFGGRATRFFSSPALSSAPATSTSRAARGSGASSEVPRPRVGCSTDRCPGSAAPSVVLVVVDGLRADTAADPHVMPELSRVAAAGHCSTSHVLSPVPSSLAGIIALSTGRVSAPGESVFDFKAQPAGGGGIFQAVADLGGRSFVAGPTLWTDLYGQWITASELDASFGGQDAKLLEATLQAIRSGKYALVVVHFGATDAAAHQYGTASPEYLAAARWSDRAIGRIHQTLPASVSLLVTSDHGNTRAGGHAGPEPDVLATPLVTVTPNADIRPPSDLPQTAIAGLVLNLLDQSASAAAEPASATRTPGRLPDPQPSETQPVPARWGTNASLAVAILCGLCVCSGLGVCSGLTGPVDGRRQAFVLDLAFWTALTVALGGWTSAALVLALAALCGTAVAAARKGSAPGAARLAGYVLLLLSGVGVGWLRLVDGAASLHSDPSGGSRVAVLLLIGLLVVIGFGAEHSLSGRVRVRGIPASAFGDLKAWSGERAQRALGGSWIAAWGPQGRRGALALPARRSGGLRGWRGGLLGRRGWPQLGLLVGGGVAAYLLGGLPLFAVCGLALVAGSGLARVLRASQTNAVADGQGPRFWPVAFAGAALPLLQVLLARALGETASLSTVDVRAGFAVAELPLGIGLAAVLVAASQAMPTAALLLGCGPALLRLSGRPTGGLCVGLYAIAVGQTVSGVLWLSLGPSGPPGDALAVGVLVRTLAESVFVFLGWAAMLLIPWERVGLAAAEPTTILLGDRGNGAE